MNGRDSDRKDMEWTASYTASLRGCSREARGAKAMRGWARRRTDRIVCPRVGEQGLGFTHSALRGVAVRFRMAKQSESKGGAGYGLECRVMVSHTSSFYEDEVRLCRSSLCWHRQRSLGCGMSWKARAIHTVPFRRGRSMVGAGFERQGLASLGIERLARERNGAAKTQGAHSTLKLYAK